MFSLKIHQWLLSSRGPLELEATALPTEPQPLPNEAILTREDVLINPLKWVELKRPRIKN